MLLISKSLVLWISCVNLLLVSVESNSEKCIEKDKCGDCIQIPGCAWCAERRFSGNRCNEINELKDHCSPPDIQDPQKTKPVPSTRQGQTDKDTVTVKPGKYTVSGRIGDKVNVTMEFNDQPKKPLDLYYLLDSSCTMAAVIEQVKTSARELARNLEKLTSDLRLGLGGFVDKTVVPFISDPNDVNVPLICHNRNGIGPYGYRNYLKLSNSSMFLEAINKHQTSYNRDNPEGQLDALFQAVVCDPVIDWKQERIRVIVLATDAEFHLAGDGKIGGIIMPHDGACHMEAKTSKQIFENVKTYQEYTHSTKMDYPSISFLNTKIKEKRVLVIFAIRHYVELYNELSQLLQGSAVVELTETGRNIQTLIEKEFEKLISKIEVGTLPESDCFGLTYYALCPNQTDYVKGGECSNRNNLEGPRNITFKIEIEFKKCDSGCPKRIQIPISFTHKTLGIDLNPICECNCSSQMGITTSPSNSNSTTGQGQKNTCKNDGRFHCGVCECARNYCGMDCEIKTDEDPNRRKCLQDGVECSGRGTCNCGRCSCNTGYQGPYCEYDRSKCPQNNGRVCSGSSFGSCNATTNSERIQSFQCDCRQGYTGRACGCSPLKINCQSGTDTQIHCSNKGSCDCNSCNCLDGYCGPLCQHCFFKDQEAIPTLTSPAFKKCLQCYLNDVSANKNQPKSNTAGAGCSQYCKDANLGNVTIVKELECGRTSRSAENLGSVNLMNKIGCESSAVSCGTGEVRDDRTQCTHNFTYECSPSDRNILTIKLNSIAQECPKPVNLFLIGVSGGAVILLIGIITLLIWRIATYMYDKREYERFKAEIENPQFGRNDNPLFEGATKNFSNPAHNRKSIFQNFRRSTRNQ